MRTIAFYLIFFSKQIQDCRQVPTEECRSDEVQVCKKVPKQKCRMYYKQKCHQAETSKGSCERVPLYKPKCKKVPKQKCKTTYVDRCKTEYKEVKGYRKEHRCVWPPAKPDKYCS